MQKNEYLLPKSPVVVGFVLSFALIAVDVAWIRSGNLIGGGLVVFLLSLALSFMVKSENDNIADKSVPDWRDIKDDEAANQRVQDQLKRSLDVEVGHHDKALMKKRIRQSTSLFWVLAVLALGVIIWTLYQPGLNLAYVITAALAPYAVWAAFWGCVAILSRGPDMSVQSFSTDITEHYMGGRQMGSVELWLMIAAMFYGILGAGPLEYMRHRRISSEGSAD